MTFSLSEELSVDYNVTSLTTAMPANLFLPLDRVAKTARVTGLELFDDHCRAGRVDVRLGGDECGSISAG
jgi:hypothetical protein